MIKKMTKRKKKKVKKKKKKMKIKNFLQIKALKKMKEIILIMKMIL